MGDVNPQYVFVFVHMSEERNNSDRLHSHQNLHVTAVVHGVMQADGWLYALTHTFRLAKLLYLYLYYLEVEFPLFSSIFFSTDALVHTLSRVGLYTRIIRPLYVMYVVFS